MEITVILSQLALVEIWICGLGTEEWTSSFEFINIAGINVDDYIGIAKISSL